MTGLSTLLPARDLKRFSSPLCTTGVRFWATCYDSEERLAVFSNFKTTFLIVVTKQ